MRKYYLCVLICLIHSYSLSQDIIIKQSVLSAMAINSSSDNSVLTGTIGQSIAGKMESDNTILSAGLWGAVSSITLGIDDLIPRKFSISNAYPNPFNPTVNIDFSISEESEINIKIFDLLGRNLFSHEQNFNAPGKYRFQWHGINDSGTPIASGIYLVTVQHKTNIFKQKITFLK